MLKGSGHPPIEKVCAYCRKKFIVNYKSRDQRYCSLQCTSLSGWKNRRQTFEKPCEICGKSMFTRASRIASGRGKYCSKKCYWKGMSIAQTGKTMPEGSRIKLSLKRRGELNPAYKHGESYNFSHYGSEFNRLLKEKIIKRDNYHCQVCNSAEELLVHHLNGNQRDHNLNNLITWCITCHMKYHRDHG